MMEKSARHLTIAIRNIYYEGILIRREIKQMRNRQIANKCSDKVQARALNIYSSTANPIRVSIDTWPESIDHRIAMTLSTNLGNSIRKLPARLVQLNFCLSLSVS